VLILRSIAFNALFYLNTVIYLIIGLPTFFMPYRAIVGVAKSWGRTNLVLLRVVAGIDCEIRGREKIPKGPLIVASKHQSAWETFALLPLLENPVFILKRELQLIPIFGWLTIKGRMVPVRRGGGSQALTEALRELAKTCPAIAVEAAPEAGDARYQPVAAAPQMAPEPALPAGPRERWWIASYSALSRAADSLDEEAALALGGIEDITIEDPPMEEVVRAIYDANGAR